MRDPHGAEATVGEAAIGAFAGWLIGEALPLFARHGVDRERGGFHEKLGFDLEPIAAPRRARLVARQIYCFATAPALGWDGPAEQLVHHGVAFLRNRLIAADGTVIMATNSDGTDICPGHDLYDYAFVLFALAAADPYLPGEARRLGRLVRDRLVSGFANAGRGFREDLPMKANSHMHLFEAFLAWEKIAGAEEPEWGRLADDIAALALERLIDPATGALSEFFDADWRPNALPKDRLVEPGHQFEWSWLLHRWSETRGRVDGYRAALRLAELGEEYGVDSERGVAIDALDGTLVPREAGARLWPQTERLKVWHTLATHPKSDESLRARAVRLVPCAVAGLSRFFVHSPSGLWREVMRADGSFVEEPVRASSLYHLVCALQAVSAPAPALRAP